MAFPINANDNTIRNGMLGTNRYTSGQMSQNIQNWKDNRNSTSQAKWGMW